MTTQSDVVMSVCTGAYVLGDAGVLKGKKATTHHLYYDEFQKTFPDVLLQKDKRFVQSDSVIFTAGGLSSGIDLALHVVELYSVLPVLKKLRKFSSIRAQTGKVMGAQALRLPQAGDRRCGFQLWKQSRGGRDH